MEFLSDLNPQQKEAATTSEGYLRVIAGAGSGKTKLLVSRYAYLVKALGIDPANILCVTFTNKAAGEMRRRVRALIGEGYDTSLIATYHSFCARVLREDVEKVFFPNTFRIIDTAEQKEILGEIYAKLDLKMDHATFEKILKRIGQIKAEPDYVPYLISNEYTQFPDKSADRVAQMYLQKQKSIYALDFDDLINFALYLFEHCPEIRKKWQDRLNYIQVDEFQDSAAKEMRLVDILSEKYHNLMIVGDPDQNIYEWRGSDVRLLVDFDKSHPGTQTLFLNRNYRSTPQILACANALIRNNQLRLEKDLFTLAPAGQEVVHCHAKTEHEEMKWIAQTIADLKKKGTKFADIALLYRSSFLSRLAEKILLENGIPYEIFGGIRFYDRMEIKDALAYLRLIIYGDDPSFRRIVNTPRRRIGRLKLAALVGWQKEGQTLYETMREHLDDPIFRGSGAESFVKMIEELRACARDLPISDLTDLALARSGYEAYIRELGDMERFDNLTEFKRLAHEYEESMGESVSLEEFLAQTALQSDVEPQTDVDKVKLMTIHASKGLEFPYVFAIGFSEGVFPSSKTIETRKQLGLEEERRLCYVAITRARKGLYLTDSEGTSAGGSRKLPSRFLREIGEENYTRIGVIPRDLLDESIRAAGGTPVADGDCPVGKTITHPVFGVGEVISEDARTRAFRVRFETVGERNLSREFVTIALFSPQTEITPEPEPEPVTQTPQSVQNKPEERQDPSPVPRTDLSIGPLPPEQETQTETTEQPDVGLLSLELSFAKTETPEPEPEPDTPPAKKTTRSRTYELTDDPSQINFWKRSDVPHEGWVCTGITDLGKPSAVCGMCSIQTIRYVHHMHHPAYGNLDVGCDCAGRMEGNLERARAREREFKNLAARRANFARRQWKQSRAGNPYLKVCGRHVVLYRDKEKNVWHFSVDGTFYNDAFSTKEKAALAVFDFINR